MFIKLKEDLKVAMKKKKRKETSAIRVILGELARLNTKEPPDDKKVTSVLRKLQKNEKMVIGKNEPTVFLNVVESYLPQQMSTEDITDYIINFDLTPYKNKMQAMGPIMKGLGGNVNGQVVKDILLEMI